MNTARCHCRLSWSVSLWLGIQCARFPLDVIIKNGWHYYMYLHTYACLHKRGMQSTLNDTYLNPIAIYFTIRSHFYKRYNSDRLLATLLTRIIPVWKYWPCFSGTYTAIQTQTQTHVSFYGRVRTGITRSVFPSSYYASR